MLFAAEILWIWVFTNAPTILAYAHPPDSMLVTSRLDRLESLMADHQAQFQRERDLWEKEKEILQHERAQWQREKQTLTENFHLLQGDVHALQREKEEMRREMEAMQNSTKTLTQTLVAESQGLSAELGDVRRQLASVKRRRRQSLRDRMTQYATKLRPAKVEGGEGREEDTQTPGGGGGTGRAAQTPKHRQDPEKTKDPNHLHSRDPSHHANDPDSVTLFNNPDPAQQRDGDPDPSRHVRLVRSDDQGPLEAVTSHLAQQMTEVTAVIQALKAADAQQRHDIQAAGGSTFIQWGSSTCAGSSQLVYSGAVGGSYETHTGGAANFLCLSMSPKLQNTSPGTTYTLLYGGEYQTDDSRHQTDPVCAVCRSPQPTTIMVPGTDVCVAGWTLQYSGFLMAGHYTDPAATEFICVDSKLESATRSQQNDNGHLLYFTKTQCGSLPCPPYHDNMLVTCAVCSK